MNNEDMGKRIDEILKPLHQLRGLTTEDSTELARQDLNTAKQALREWRDKAIVEELETIPGRRVNYVIYEVELKYLRDRIASLKKGK